MLRREARRSGLQESLGPALSEMRELTADFTSELVEAGEAMKTLDGQSGKLSKSLSFSLRTAFDRAVFGGERLGDVFRGLASSVAGKALDTALKPVTTGLSGALTGVLGGIGKSLIPGIGFADGGAFSSGRVRAFARGGVVTGPTAFPMRGATGLMGEAGPEAIMPLSRGPDGKLGVAARGRQATQQITVNIAAQDVQSFQRSRGQIAAQLARAVRSGQSAL